MRKGLAVAAGVAALTLFEIAAANAQTGPFAGPYVGALAGGAYGNVTILSPDAYPDPATFNLTPAGFLAGTYAGVNVVVPGAGAFVGVEGIVMGGWLGDSDVITDYFSGDGLTITGSTQLRWQGGLLARAGFATGPVLIYATGGIMVGGFADRYTDRLEDVYIPNDPYVYYDLEANSGVRIGWAAGAGMELALGNGWALRGQYLLTGFGSRDVQAVSNVGNQERTVTFQNGLFHTFFLGISRYF